METRPHEAAQAHRAGYTRGRRAQVGVLAQGLLAHLELSNPPPRAADRLLDPPGPGGVPRTLPPFPGCQANRRMRTRTPGGVGGAGVSPAPTRSFVAGGRAPRVGVPDPELVEQAKRRKFTVSYKLGILTKADACTAPGEIGELLRREGLYTSHLTYWRKQRRDGVLKELGRPRGRKPADRRDQEIAVLQRRLERSESELSKARKVIEIQGNLSALLEQMLGTETVNRSTER